MKSLRNKIIIYTAVPVIIIILIAGAVMTGYVGQLVDSMYRTQTADSTALECGRVVDLMDRCSGIVVEKADDINVRRFLQTALDRTEMEDNAYFSYAMGALDSVMSDSSSLISRTWLASSDYAGVAFSNTSAGWTAPGDFDVKTMAFFRHFSDGAEYFFSDPYISPISNEAVITVAAPVTDSRTRVMMGVYCADIRIDELYSAIHNIAAQESEAKNTLIVNTGNNVIIYYDDISYIYESFDKINLQNQGIINGTSEYNVNGIKMTGTEITPLNSGWTVYSLRSYEERDLIKSQYSWTTFALFACVGIILVAALSFASQKIAKPIQNYTHLITSLDIENGNSETLVPQGCRELEDLAIGFNSLIRKNSSILGQLREINKRSEREKILYRTALESSSDVIFEYDMQSDVLSTYGSVTDISVPKTIVTDIGDFLNKLKTDEIYTAVDKDYALKFFSGEINGELIVSKRFDNGTVHWLSFEGKTFETEGCISKIVGKIRCIDEVITLKEGAERDLLSGFYNKATTEKIIEKRLQSDNNNSAVIIIDIDNFKSTNDIFGHEYGDFVIKDISAKISRLISADAVAGRIGGDEFMIYAPCKDETAVTELCGALCRSIKHTYTCEGITGRVSVSASIGAVLSSVYGKNFETLYRLADIAMYVSKTGGKDKYTVYDDQERPEYIGRQD